MSMLSDNGFTDVISEINKGTSVRREQIQDALLFCAYKAQADRNTDPTIRLFAVIGNETNRRAISHWLSTNAPVYFKEGAPKLGDKRQKEWTGTLVEYEAAIQAALPWYKMGASLNKAENVWDGNDEMLKLRQRIAKLEKDAAKHDDKELSAALALVNATLNNVEYGKKASVK